jgi:two-component system chemotaxis response regulator CheY
MRALVVDDSRAMRRIIAGILGEVGFDAVEEAANGKAALEVLGKGPSFDLALVDWNMPEMDGLELVRKVRAQARFASMKLVMVTTEVEMARISEALGAGADEYVMKPFTREVLRDKLSLLQLRPPTR